MQEKLIKIRVETEYNFDEDIRNIHNSWDQLSKNEQKKYLKEEALDDIDEYDIIAGDYFPEVEREEKIYIDEENSSIEEYFQNIIIVREVICTPDQFIDVVEWVKSCSCANIDFISGPNEIRNIISSIDGKEKQILQKLYCNKIKYLIKCINYNEEIIRFKFTFPSGYKKYMYISDSWEIKFSEPMTSNTSWGDESDVLCYIHGESDITNFHLFYDGYWKEKKDDEDNIYYENEEEIGVRYDINDVIEDLIQNGEFDNTEFVNEVIEVIL